MKNVLLMACVATLVLTGCGSDNPHSYNTTTSTVKPATPVTKLSTFTFAVKLPGMKPSIVTSADAAELNEMVMVIERVDGENMHYGITYNSWHFGGGVHAI